MVNLSSLLLLTTKFNFCASGIFGLMNLMVASYMPRSLDGKFAKQVCFYINLIATKAS